ncbi:hypothetical protein [Flavobacterium psychrotrophum]|uniref:hypothetical protein n=1 Tax=Flavobacterium psychrotrophum TaxID=2294119 RepID=UPI000E31AAAB|nr:hypothetical protein [Flavobacterium psychrotrophum]
MFTNLLKLLLLCFAFPCIAQQYDFDYVQEYHFENNGTTHKSGDFYKFFNSKDNSFSLTVTPEGEKLYMTLRLANGKIYTDSMEKNDFLVYAISLKCPKTGFYNGNPDTGLENYTYSKLEDTLITDKAYSYVKLAPKNEKKSKKKELNTYKYIFDNSYNFTLSITGINGMLNYFEKNGITFPPGVIKEFYTCSPSGEVISHTKLIQCVPMQKIIFLDTACK